MTLGLSQALSNNALLVGTSVSLIGGGSPSFVGDPLSMFTPWGFDTTKITGVTGTVTLRIDLPTLAIRDAIAVWYNMVKGTGVMRIINSAGPTTIQTWTPQDAKSPRSIQIFSSIRGFWRRLIGTAFDRIEFDFTPAVTAGSEPGDADPIEIFRFHVANDVVEVPSTVFPVRRTQVGMAPMQSGISQRRARPLVNRGVGEEQWAHITWDTVSKLLEVWRNSDYGACPVITLVAYDTEVGNPPEGFDALCVQLMRPVWRPRVQPADSFAFIFDARSNPHEQYPNGPEAVF